MCTKLEMALDKSGLLISKSGKDRNVGLCWLWREGRAGFLTENSRGLWYFPSGLVLRYVFRRDGWGHRLLQATLQCLEDGRLRECTLDIE